MAFFFLYLFFCSLYFSGFSFLHLFTLSLDFSALLGMRRGREVKREKMVVLLDQNFMTRVPENVIRHSKELKLRKKIAEQQEKMALLMDAIDVLLDQ